MSQELTPISGGRSPEIQTTVKTTRVNALSRQYVEANNLQSRSTEWVPGGRPIYNRLPGASETYRIDFFNRVTESNVTGNTSVRTNIVEIGYVYVPWGENINGPTSSEVVAADGNKVLLIKGGNIVWKYGKTATLPTIVDLSVLDVSPSKYDVAYQLIYDDAPVSNLYAVADFALTGQSLNLTSSTDAVIGWRYPTVNAFLNSAQRWSNEDTFFPTSVQPTTAFLQWTSELSASYSSVTLRCPSDTAYSGTATLYYVDGTGLGEVMTVNVSRDTTGQFFRFDIPTPIFQTGWKVSFSSLSVSIQSVIVSGTLTLLEPLATPSPRATLVMYPSGALPKTVLNSQGEEIPATYAKLAEVDCGADYEILDINDTREIIRRDYVPVADWLTTPFDQDLINLYEQVSEYSPLWMSPPTCLKQEYAKLETDQIEVKA